MMRQYYPWQATQWRTLSERRLQDVLPHALLLHGPGGTGKADFAICFAHSLLCQKNHADGQPCGDCSSCRLYAANNHPDYHLIEPEKQGGQIKIDQIRNLIADMGLSSHSGGYKVVIIRPAEAMNTAAANSLLKTLEEPPAKTLIMLLAEQLTHLPATVRSRCQLLRFNLPDKTMAQNWLVAKLTETGASADDAAQLLAMTHGAPLSALADAEKDQLVLRQSLFEMLEGLADGRLDPVKIAGEWLKIEQPIPIKYLHGWVSDMIRLRQVPDYLQERVEYQKVLHSLSGDLDVQKLYIYMDRIAESLPLLAQLNPLPIIESLLIQWANIPKQKAGMQR
ncbi:DNA polymerase III delta prime subunit [hydrothermal vent metagenome]|uniref:DNA polymerase III delta prime subunit n=1 Tax=hydrothermal vent metagenome TaxID=652676 RepID=A0A3B1B1N2_9ZZZZ